MKIEGSASNSTPVSEQKQCGLQTDRQPIFASFFEEGASKWLGYYKS